jgi:hypothetical protein
LNIYLLILILFQFKNKPLASGEVYINHKKSTIDIKEGLFSSNPNQRQSATLNRPQHSPLLLSILFLYFFLYFSFLCICLYKRFIKEEMLFEMFMIKEMCENVFKILNQLISKALLTFNFFLKNIFIFIAMLLRSFQAFSR